jgi:recombination protein RecA
MGNPNIEKTPNSLAYQVDTKMKLTYSEPWENSEGHEIGKIINYQCVCSSVGPPGKKVKTRFRYNFGLDEVAEIIDFGMDFGVIKKSGSWISYGELKGHGWEDFYNTLKDPENLAAYEEIKGRVKELFGDPDRFKW